MQSTSSLDRISGLWRMQPQSARSMNRPGDHNRRSRSSLNVFYSLVYLGLSPVACADRSSAPPLLDNTTVAAPVQSAIATPTTQPPALRTEWNFDDTNVETNGNVEVAIALLQDIDQLDAPIHDVEPIMRAPWKWYGTLVCFVNVVALIQDEPLEQGMEIGDVVTASGDGHIVEYLLLGGSGSIAVGSRVKLCGFPVGRMQVDNKLGGKFTHLMIVGKT